MEKVLYLYSSREGQTTKIITRIAEQLGDDAATIVNLHQDMNINLDEFDKVTDRNTQRNILSFLDGRIKFPVEGKQVENRTCTMVTLNTKIGKESIARFGIPEQKSHRLLRK